MKEFVKVPLNRIKELLDYENQLLCLESGGVDNWEWYGECFDDYDSNVSNEEVEAEFVILTED